MYSPLCMMSKSDPVEYCIRFRFRSLTASTNFFGISISPRCPVSPIYILHVEISNENNFSVLFLFIFNITYVGPHLFLIVFTRIWTSVEAPKEYRLFQGNIYLNAYTFFEEKIYPCFLCSHICFAVNCNASDSTLMIFV